jgi:TIR domain/Sel1 repeat
VLGLSLTRVYRFAGSTVITLRWYKKPTGQIMTDIFISYAHEDRPRAQVLAQTLEGQRWSIFWDRTIPIGKTWRDTIGKELGNARCVIVLWSKTSIESGWVQEEADDAKRRGILVPVLIENAQPPIGFRSIQTADLVDWDATEPTEAFRRLIFDIAALVGPPIEAERKEEQRTQADSEARLKAEARPKPIEEAEAEKENKKRPPSDQPSPLPQGPRSATPEQREQSEPSEQPKTEEPRSWSRQTILIVGALAVVLLTVVPFIMRQSPSDLANVPAPSPSNLVNSQARQWYDAALKGDAEARTNLEKAAAKGDASAMLDLGTLYRHDDDNGKAREWWEKAAAKGDARAMDRLGVLYEKGYGVTQDYAKAREWYEKGAAKGNAHAMANLAMLYYYGYGVAKDPAKASELMDKSLAIVKTSPDSSRQ